jgi:phage repressor protein C with HTH and peptisase S24 domain
MAREMSRETSWGMAVVRGRSMLPTLRDGDRLVVQYGARPSAGRLAVVRLPDGTVAVKRLELEQADGWWVSRDNAEEGVDSWTLGRAVSEVLAVVRWRLWPRPGRV